MANFVQEYRSTDQGAWPTLTGQAGSLIALLSAILVTGGSTASVSSLTSSGTTATATLSSSNSTLQTGDNIVIAGATPSGYNGTVQITVVDGTHFTYPLSGTLASPATGTITYAKAPLGWTEPFSGTNLAVFRSADASYPQCYLRIDETGVTAGGQKECAVRAFETMSDVNTGTGSFPTVAQQANGLCWRKSTTADSTARAWTLFGDDRCFYLIINSDASSTLGRFVAGFGALNTYKSGDGYNAFLSGASTFNSGSVSNFNAGLSSVNSFAASSISQTGLYVDRSYTQSGGAIPAQAALPCASSTPNTTGAATTAMFNIPYPNGPDSGIYVSPLFSTELASGLHVRGLFPGLYTHMHTTQPCLEYDKITNVVGLSGVTLVAVSSACSNASGMVLFDKFGPW